MNARDAHDLDVLVLGDARPDVWVRGVVDELAFDDRGRAVDDVTLELGGSGAVTAAATARLGLRTGFAGVVGDDTFGSFVHDGLAAAGVDVSGLVRLADRATGASVVVTRGSDRAIVAAPGVADQVHAERVDREALRRVRHLHVAGYFALTGLHAGLPDLLAAVREASGSTSIDPGADPSDRWDAGLLTLLDRVDVLFPNSSEVRRITGIDDVDVAAQSLAERGSTLAIKFGQGGGMVLRGEETMHVEAAPADVVDRAGAGSAFDAGFLGAMLAGESPERCLRLAVACGTLAVGRRGAVAALPTREEAVAAATPRGFRS